jgi:YD repeat-containing protein
MNGSWIPAGDDAAGRVWTYQQYDWKGRPTLTTNPDGTTTEATYGGCGCAGGEVVTVRDEVGRRQRVTSDILGRPLKTEVLNWDQSVYSSVTNNYNARDQVTGTVEQMGTSGTSQTTTLTYDGYGRLQTKLSPEQTAATTYAYNADDTVQSVTDARGVVSTFSYNNRHLATNISHTAPAGITSTASVSFTYDAVGNRTTMTDGSGSTSYSYNQLSQLTSETRQFTGLSGSYTLSYAYNLSGALTSITDPFSASVGYQYDQVGRVSAVTGAGFANVSSYASNLQYRAWGGVKSMSYGNGLSMSIGYDARLRSTSYVVPGIISKSYDYDADSRLHFSHDALNAKFDRSYAYDHVGRITQALSGAEARLEGTTNLRPYKQTFQYDAFNHLTGRPINEVWSGTGGAFSPLSQSYQNERNTAWEYDAAGNLINSGDVQYTIAAGGEATRVVSDIYLGFNPQSGVWGVTTDLTQSYDGQDVVTKKVEATTTHDNEWGDETTTAITYLLRSSVLGGKVIAEIDGVGQKQRGFVYLGNNILAWQARVNGVDYVQWEHRDISNASFRVTNSNASLNSTQSAELDPLGTNAGLYDSNPATQGWQKMSWYPGFGSSFASSDTQCMLDFVTMPCGMVIRTIEVGIRGGTSGGSRTSSIPNLIPTRVDDPETGEAHLRGFNDSSVTVSDHYHYELVPSGWITTEIPLRPSQEVFSHHAPQNPVPYVDSAILKKCISDIFDIDTVTFIASEKGRMGTFIGYGPDSLRNGGNNTLITVKNDRDRYSRDGITGVVNRENMLYNLPPYPNGSLTGYTSPDDPYKNYTANNLDPMDALKTQIHELAHSLQHIITGLHNEGENAVEMGWRLESCVDTRGGFKER